MRQTLLPRGTAFGDKRRAIPATPVYDLKNAAALAAAGLGKAKIGFHERIPPLAVELLERMNAANSTLLTNVALPRL